MRRRLLILALLFDVTVGDPPNRWHPVAWMGSAIYWLKRNTPQQGKFIYGGFIAWGGAVIVWTISSILIRLLNRLPSPVNDVIQAWILKNTIALQGLNNAAYEVESALDANDLAEARHQLSWHLVSRDTAELNESQVSAATIESIAENTSDGIIAPLFWYGIGGIPAALTYRYLQTCDSILGYRDEQHEWLGKIPARTDDILNLIPARLTALCLILLKPSAWSIWRRDAQITESPNAGHPMSAMAGALDIELEKIDHYQLNEGASQPQVADIKRARYLMFGIVGLFTLGLFIRLGKK